MEPHRLPTVRDGIDERFGLRQDQLERAAHGLPNHADMATVGLPNDILAALYAGRIKQPDVLPNLTSRLSAQHRFDGDPLLTVHEMVARSSLIADLAQTCIRGTFGSQQPQR